MLHLPKFLNKMKKLLIPAAAIFALGALMTSCKKEDGGKSRHDMIVGKWVNYQHGEDTNNNGVWDAAEMITDTGSNIVPFDFKADGSGSATANFMGTTLPITFTWNLQNGDNDLRVITTFMNNTDTSIATILTLTDNNMVIKDASVTPIEFTSFNKQ